MKTFKFSFKNPVKFMVICSFLSELLAKCSTGPVGAAKQGSLTRGSALLLGAIGKGVKKSDVNLQCFWKAV